MLTASHIVEGRPANYEKTFYQIYENLNTNDKALKALLTKLGLTESFNKGDIDLYSVVNKEIADTYEFFKKTSTPQSSHDLTKEELVGPETLQPVVA